MAEHFGKLTVICNMYKHTVVYLEGLSKTLHQPQHCHSLHDKASEVCTLVVAFIHLSHDKQICGCSPSGYVILFKHLETTNLVKS